MHRPPPQPTTDPGTPVRRDGAQVGAGPVDLGHHGDAEVGAGPVDLSHHGDAEVGAGLVDLAVN
ncbi:hypothetical protein GSF22_29780, partial [Micromonospora echinofusca]|nr:hypothetical protein [Micromonospora echinofusca]